mmetsp:Transcript_52485/g.113645  ORF Transcript_52485/g.113645 Transcript_52485/m.113645 type:complete len:853 (-) Transcript_52485:371-2929(-)
MVSKSAVIGIDLGSQDSYVAFVGKGNVDIVQNEVSKRSTSSLVGFTAKERLLGDEALAQIKSNAKNTARNFKHLLGQKLGTPYVEAELFWSTCALVEAADGCPGYEVTYKGESRVISAVQATAMFLTKLREITERWTQSKVADCVIGVPASFSDSHRQALLDAARIAGLSVLRLMNEHTATALAYGIYRSSDFDPEKPQTVAFCSMGHSIFSVSIVQFLKGKLQVLCETSDKVGGRDMVGCLMKEFAAQFKKKVGCDPLSNKKASFKLEDSVVKTMKVLSANSEAPVNVECLMEDEDFASNISRDAFLAMCEPMMKRVQAVLDGAKAASGLKNEEIDSIEMIGGASRVPWVKEMCAKAFATGDTPRDLSTTMNADESVARGCALQAAILSPLYKVRDFEVKDTSKFGVNIGWVGSAADAEAAKEDGESTQMPSAEGEYKTTTLFPAYSAVNTSKMLTFCRKGPFEVKAEYESDAELIPGTTKELGTFRIELPPQTESKKVKVKAKLTLHGTFTIESAQLVEEEEYDETVKEKRELPQEPTEEAAAAEGTTDAQDAKTDGKTDAKTEGKTDGKTEEEAKSPKKEPEKKFEWVDVVRRKKRTKRTDLPITKIGVPGIDDAHLQKLTDEETAMQSEMKDLIETNDRRNDLESYILTMRSRVAEGAEYGAFIAPDVREKFLVELDKMEDWLYDTEEPTKVMYVEKLEELKTTGDPVVWRFKESQIRAEWIQALSVTVSNYRGAAESPGDKYGHISPENLAKITAECDAIAKWLSDMQAKQSGMQKYDNPVLLSADMEVKNQALAKFADDILKEPKPKPAEPVKEEAPPADASPAAEAAPEGQPNEQTEGTGVADVD